MRKLYHAVISDGHVVKTNTIEAPSPEGAMMRAVREWLYNGGETIISMAAYEFKSGDSEYIYQWSKPGTFKGRPNLLEPNA